MGHGLQSIEEEMLTVEKKNHVCSKIKKRENRIERRREWRRE